jgi:hypothetical protein
MAMISERKASPPITVRIIPATLLFLVTRSTMPVTSITKGMPNKRIAIIISDPPGKETK